jgi:broad specificity phosphatase PhoE
MVTHIHLIRHAESEHNVTKDFSTPDPSLTALGIQQAQQLVRDFPHSDSISIVLTSPLKRAVQTTLAGFPHLLDSRNFPPGSGRAGGVEGGARLLVDPDLQERSDLPCDTGSDRAVLEASFPGVDFAPLRDGWQAKEGVYAADDEAVEARAGRVRRRLAGLAGELKDEEKKKDIVVVTHGVFMKFLSGDASIDLPKAGWRSYTIGKTEAGEVTLLPVA